MSSSLANNNSIDCLGKTHSPLTGLITSLTSAANRLSMMALARRVQEMVTFSLDISELVAACAGAIVRFFAQSMRIVGWGAQ